MFSNGTVIVSSNHSFGVAIWRPFVRYFTKYYAPDYSPALGQYAIQAGTSRVKTGNYPIVNAYANFHLKRTRFFVMMSHINGGSGSKEYFLTPHYPLNGRIFRFGLSWNFYN